MLLLGKLLRNLVQSQVGRKELSLETRDFLLSLCQW